MVRSKTIHKTFAIAAGAVLMLAAPRAAVAQSLLWTDPEPLNNNAPTDSGLDMTPQLTTDGAGHWVAAWRSYDDLGGTIGPDADILVAHSSNNGETWTYPQPLNKNAPTNAEADDDYQEVTTDGTGNWAAVWHSTDSLGETIGPDHDILVARSNDNGETWTYPESLNNNNAVDSATDIRPQVTTNRAGTWVAIWNSVEDMGGTITLYVLVACSSDDGVNWTDPVPINGDATTDSGDYAQVKLATDGAGHWVAVWESPDKLGGTLGDDGDYDILVARSSEPYPCSASAWTYPQALNANAATGSGGDWHPQLTTDGAGTWVAVWYSSEDLDPPGPDIGTDSDILVAHSTDNGLTWTDPKVLNNHAYTDVGADVWPEVTNDRAGNWVTVWASTSNLGGGTEWDILVGAITTADLLDGGSWTDAELLNTNAATDSEGDWHPQVTTDGAGNWVGVWYSNEDLYPPGPDIGTDGDILVTRGRWGRGRTSLLFPNGASSRWRW